MNRPLDRGPAHILLIEDNPGDVVLTRKSLEEAGADCHLHVVPDGQAALAFLAGDPLYGAPPTPDLIVLDLHLPGMDGKTVLSTIRSQPRLRHLPVAVLSSSAATTDVMESYALGANCYVQKPLAFDEFRETLRAMSQFWLQTVTLPNAQ